MTHRPLFKSIFLIPLSEANKQALHLNPDIALDIVLVDGSYALVAVIGEKADGSLEILDIYDIIRPKEGVLLDFLNEGLIRKKLKEQLGLEAGHIIRAFPDHLGRFYGGKSSTELIYNREEHSIGGR